MWIGGGFPCLIYNLKFYVFKNGNYEGYFHKTLKYKEGLTIDENFKNKNKIKDERMKILECNDDTKETKKHKIFIINLYLKENYGLVVDSGHGLTSTHQLTCAPWPCGERAWDFYSLHCTPS